MIVDRPLPLQRIRDALAVHPAAALTGPRQCGKTTLARLVAAREPSAHCFDLEAASHRRRLENPEEALGRLSGLVIVDEVQRSPALFETVRVLVDRPSNSARFLLLGSASPTLVRGVSESLAGRTGLVDLAGFSLEETGPDAWRDLWVRGGFPRSYLAPGLRGSVAWRRSFVRTFLERDVPQLGIAVPAARLRRSWTMIAHFHGQVWNAAEFARSLGVSEGTARNYLDILDGAFVVRVLPPWFENLKKRQVKSPKIYVRDAGILHSLLGLANEDDVAGHPKCGASFEGFVIEQILDALDPDGAYFWATHAGAELDLMIFLGGKRYGFECKFADAPGPTRSMRAALADLRLDHLWTVCPGSDAYDLGPSLSVVPVAGLPALLRELAGRRQDAVAAQ